MPDQASEIDLGGCTVAMVHDGGAAGGRARRLRRWFPDADVVVFGHSHVPWHEVDRRADGHEQHHVNPGSPTERRSAPHPTVAWLLLDGGRVQRVEHVDVTPVP
jgi:predicted phosphodiesterase